MGLLKQIPLAAGATVLFLMAACSTIEATATPAIDATAKPTIDVTEQTQADRKLATLTPRPTPQPEDTTTRPTQTAAPLPSPTPTRSIREIFDLLDRGIISEEEAATELNKRKEGGSLTATSTQPPSPTPLATPTPVPTQPSDRRGSAQWVSQLEAEVHELVNEERLKASLNRLAFDSALADVARSHSQDMATNTFFAHDNLNGQSPTDRTDAAGYSCINQGYYGVGENIFKGWLFSAIMTYQSTSTKAYFALDEIAQVVVDGWMNSPGHRKNMLTARYTKEGIGIGINPDTEAVLVTQDLC